MTSNENANSRPLTPAMEDYLETIYDIGQEKTFVRVKDIAGRLNVKMPTVTSMLKTLRDRGLVHYGKYEYVELTSTGTEVGREMRRRHEVLLQFLTHVLKIEPQVADQEACKMEHALSEETLSSLTDFMHFIQVCPRAGDKWLEYFEEYRQQGKCPDKCRARAKDFSCEFASQIQSVSDPES